LNQEEKIEAVEKMQNFIENNLERKISLNDLARFAGYSPWHSARIFKEMTGYAPFEYIRALRLSRAALQLRDEKSKIVDVALDFVFDSHEGFSRAFSRRFGISPREYRRDTPAIQLFLPYRVRAHHSFLKRGGYEKMLTEKTEKNLQTIFTQVIERPQRKLLLKRGVKAKDYFAYCEETGCDEVWALLTSIKEALYEPLGLWLPSKLIKPGTSRYVQGVELSADYGKTIPEGYELLDLEPCKMMIFQGEPYPEDEESFYEKIAEVQEAMERFDPKLYGFSWADEEAPRFQLMPLGYRGYIEARPVRELNK